MLLKIALESEGTPQAYPLERVEKLLGIRYLKHLVYADWKTEQWIRAACAEAHKKGKIGQLALWLGKLHGKQIAEHEIPDVSVRWIGAHKGYGVFAEGALKKWQYIGEYTGLLRRRGLFFPNINDYCFMYPKEWRSLKAWTIDSDQEGNYTRFINHSDYPNCESVAIFYEGAFRIIFRTIEEIPAGKELCYDYGDIYWNKRRKLPEQPPEELIAPEDLKKLGL